MLVFVSVCIVVILVVFFFFFNDTATTEIYTLSLHDALPICVVLGGILAALLEMHDPRVRSPEDLQSASPVPVLAVLGEEGKRKRARLLLGPPATVLRALPRPQ